MGKSEQTRSFIIGKAADLFNRQGYQATSLSDITSATGLTKGAVYGHFNNKNELAVVAFRSKYQALAGKFSERMKECETPLEKLLAMVRYYKISWDEVSEAGGCAILNASVEVDDKLDYLRPVVRQAINSWGKVIISLIEEGKKAGHMAPDINAEYYAQTIISMIEGGIMLAKILDTHQPLFNAIDRIEGIIQSEMTS